MEWDSKTDSWVTCVPELNDISTFGATQEEALDHTREMVVGYIRSMQDVGLPLPLRPAAIRRILEALR
jgi:predicted RNase H-like HicB family nuclease